MLILQFPLQCIPCSTNKSWHSFCEVFGIDIARDFLKTSKISLDTSRLVPDILMNFEMSLAVFIPNTCTPQKARYFLFTLQGFRMLSHSLNIRERFIFRFRLEVLLKARRSVCNLCCYISGRKTKFLFFSFHRGNEGAYCFKTRELC